MKCPSCDAEVTTILASHDYTIELNSETGQWVKDVGEAMYVCGSCLQELSVHDIEDILRQVDEL